MDEEQIQTERSGFKNFLWILLIGFSTVVAIDYFIRGMTITFIAPILFLISCIAFSIAFLQKKFWRQIAFVSFVISIAIFLIMRIAQGYFGSDSLFIVLIVAFIGSTLLKGVKRILVHSFTLGICIALIVALMISQPKLTSVEFWASIRGTVIFCTIYIAIAYPTAFIQDWLDRDRSLLRKMNEFLQKQNSEKDMRERQLLEAQNQVRQINRNLEEIVLRRTQELSEKNEHLVKLSFQNAHHIRGPLARILGLIHLANIEGVGGYAILIPKIQEQAEEMDEVVKKIGREINSNIDEG